MSEEGVIDPATVDGWLEAHDDAWRRADPVAIGELFSDDGAYHLGPFEGPWRGMTGPLVGRAAIVDGWLAGTDESERFTATAETLAIEGMRAVVSRVISYVDAAGEPVERYGCVWVLDFDDDGRCRSYQEWFVPDERLAGSRET